MKKFTLLFTFLFFAGIYAWSQDIVLAGWTFPESSAAADTGILANIGNEISTIGGTSAIEFKNGLTTKAAQASGWQDGMDQKAWIISMSTEGYNNLSISSRQQSGGTDPGPKDFKLQYSIDGGTGWTDVVGGTITVENDWETSFVDNLELPENCANKPDVKIRWIMTTNEASGAGGAVLEIGKSKIDEIYIRGDQINGINDPDDQPFLSFGPNPATDFIKFTSKAKMQSIRVLDITGEIILESQIDGFSGNLNISALKNDMYLLIGVGVDGSLFYSSKIIKR